MKYRRHHKVLLAISFAVVLLVTITLSNIFTESQAEPTAPGAPGGCQNPKESVKNAIF
jgi:hypothetical protein